MTDLRDCLNLNQITNVGSGVSASQSANSESDAINFPSSDNAEITATDGTEQIEEASKFLDLINENPAVKTDSAQSAEGTSTVSEYDETTNRTTVYTIENGKRVGHKTYVGKGEGELMNECTYDEQGRVKDKKEYISEETGTKGEFFHTYTYDEHGRIATSTVRSGTNGTGPIVGDYTFAYEGDSSVPSSRTDSVHGEILEYEYDANNQRIGYTCKNTNGETIAKCQYNKDGTIASIEEDGEITLFEYEKGLAIKSNKYNSDDVDANGKPTGKPIQTDYYDNGKLSAKVRGDYTYIYEYGENGEINTIKYKSDDCEEGVPKTGAKPISNDKTEFSELKGTINSKLGQELANLAQENNMGTTMRCLSGVIKTLNAKWPEDSWETNGIRPSVAADAFVNMDNLDDPIRKHFAEVEGVSVDELKSLPAGCMVIWDNNFPGSAGMGHITFTLGDGQELSDHQCEMYLDYNTAYKVYCPID